MLLCAGFLGVFEFQFEFFVEIVLYVAMNPAKQFAFAGGVLFWCHVDRAPRLGIRHSYGCAASCAAWFARRDYAVEILGKVEE
jgi:N-acetylglutamate synthase-like GNAT family acetyltransferase